MARILIEFYREAIGLSTINIMVIVWMYQLKNEVDKTPKKADDNNNK